MKQQDPGVLYSHHLGELSRRADAALARGGFDHLVIPSGTLHYQAFDDRDYPYAVNPQFKAWLPLTRLPNSWLIHTPGKRPTLVFYQPFDYWHAVPAAPSGWWVEHFDIHIIRKPDQALALLPGDPARCAIVGEPQSALGNFVPNNPEAVINHLDWHRGYKTPYEIALMRQAQVLGVRGHRAAEAAFRAGASEFEIHMAYCQAVGQDANDLPYGNIIALNEHAAVLHYTDLGRSAPQPLRSFLIDAGASACGYASDITRTYAAAGHGEFQALVDAVDAAQIKMCEAVRAGFDYKQLHIDAHLSLMGILKDFGVITVSPEAALATGVSAAFFPHGIGHLIGAQVHDVAGFAAGEHGGRIERPAGHPYLRLTRVLEPGMVVTIEPGLYFIDMLLEEVKKAGNAASINWGRVDFFRPYGGVRIEDEVLCTEGQADNLTRPAFAAAATD
ncbi:proline dipeptidase [Stenotrophomonas pictorum JCM 9942]|uniref:Xaa-Pro dipeptidase n=1 Tax=Stenotrophomonas pictorum JCM 9942 TaxID=1236960 RepID=A0A0R0ATD5_9GAMM|nr:Xaa-Pro dipeptidase [Stenotrophomonas pictorum]KRG44974.1 proline dipeptidase [Stenotrophomonas pictorum JCM 9942]